MWMRQALPTASSRWHVAASDTRQLKNKQSDTGEKSQADRKMGELLAGSKFSLLLLSYKCEQKKDVNGIPYVDVM